MDNVSFELPSGANIEVINNIALKNDVTLTKSEQRNFDAVTFIQVTGSIVSLLQFFIWLNKQYGRHKVIKVGFSENGETEERTLDYLINYLKQINEFKKGN